MVEKAGHNKQLQRMRVDWINEGKPRASVVDDGADVQATEDDQQNGDAPPRQSERIAPIFDKTASGRPKTPDLDDLFGEDDVYRATPVDTRKTGATETGGEPDDDELDALMAETEASGPARPTKPSSGVYQSIFGGGKPRAAVPPTRVEEEDDDMDALLAEAEAEQSSRQKPAAVVTKRTETAPKAQAPGATARDGDEDEDDLDALMAEAEAQNAPAKPSGTAAAKQTEAGFEDEEEAMAEMDGLW